MLDLGTFCMDRYNSNGSNLSPAEAMNIHMVYPFITSWAY